MAPQDPYLKARAERKKREAEESGAASGGGMHLPVKFGLGQLGRELSPVNIATGLAGLLAHPSRLGEFAKGFGGSVLGTLATPFAPLGDLNPVEKIGDVLTGEGHTKDFFERAGDRGILPALVEDIGNAALVGGVASAAIKAGTAGKLANVGRLSELAGKAGFEAADLSRAASAAKGTEGVLGRRAAFKAAGVDAPVLKQYGTAAAKAQGLTAAPEEIAAVAERLRKAEKLAHPYKTLGNDIIRPRTRAAQNLATAAEEATKAPDVVTAAAATAEAAPEAAKMTAKAIADRVTETLARSQGRATEVLEDADMPGLGPEDALPAESVSGRNGIDAPEQGTPPPLGPREKQYREAAAVPVSEKVTAQVAKLPEPVQNKLAKAEGWLQAREVGKVARERARFVEADRRATISSPAMTISKQAAEALVGQTLDDGTVITQGLADSLVRDHIVAEATGTALVQRAVGNAASPELLQLIIDKTGQKYRIPNRLLDTEVPAAGLNEATGAAKRVKDLIPEAREQWAMLAAEREQRMLGSRYQGAKGLEGLEADGPVLTPAQRKEYRSIQKHYEKALGREKLVEREARAAASELLRKDDQLGKLAAEDRRLAEQIAGQDAKVRDLARPRALMDAARPMTWQRIIETTAENGGSTFDPHTGELIVPAKYGGSATGFSVGVTGTKVPLEEWVADPNAVLEKFAAEHQASLQHSDAKIGTRVPEEGEPGHGFVHLDISQTTINGRPLTRGEAITLGTARGELAIADFVGPDVDLAQDATSQLVASHHAAELFKPRSQFKRFLDMQDKTVEALNGYVRPDGETPRIHVEDFDAQAQRMQRYALAALNAGTVRSLDEFWGKVAVDSRKLAGKEPVEALFQVYLSPEFKPTETLNLQLFKDAMEYLGPDAKRALDWYYEGHDSVMSRWGDKEIQLWDHRTGQPKNVNMADLIFSLTAVTSVNAGPRDNFAHAISGVSTLVDYKKTGEWMKGIEKALDEYRTQREKTPLVNQKAPPELMATEMYDKILKNVRHLDTVRENVMEILTGRLLDEWDTQYLSERFDRKSISRDTVAKRLGKAPEALTESEWMEGAGSEGYAKIRSFYENLKDPHGSQGVTLDRVMGDLLGLTGQGYTGQQYTDAANALRTMADSASIHVYGEAGKILPHQIQALLWVYTKRLTNEHDLGRLYASALDGLDGLDNLSAEDWAAGRNPVRQYLQGDIDFANSVQSEVDTAAAHNKARNADAIKAAKAEERAKFENPKSKEANAAAKAVGDRMTAEKVEVPKKLRGRDVDFQAAPEGTMAEKVSGLTDSDLGDLRAGERRTMEQFSFFQPADVREIEAKLHPEEGSWTKAEKRVADALAAGRKSEAQDALLGWMRSEASNYSSDAEYFEDFFDAENQTPARAKVLAKAKSQGLMDDGNVLFQKFNDEVANGATFKDTTDRLVMRFFQNADPSTLVHEEGHLIRQFLPAEDISKLERSLGGRVGSVEFEEAWAEAFTTYFATGRAPQGLTSTFSRVREALKMFWGGVRGRSLDRLDPGVAEIIDKWLEPDGIENAPDLPEMKLDLAGKTAKQIASQLPARPGETAAAAKRRGYQAGRAVERMDSLERQAAERIARSQRIERSKAELTQAMTEASSGQPMTGVAAKRFPETAKTRKMTADAGRRVEKLVGKTEALTGAHVPANWKPLAAAFAGLWEEAAENPALEQAMQGMPKTFSDVVRYASEQGFDPTHISRMSEQQVQQLMFRPVQLGARGRMGQTLEGGFRKTRRGAFADLERSMAGLGAAQVDVVLESNNNALVGYIEDVVARPMPADGLVPDGWVAWDPTRSSFLRGEAITPGGAQPVKGAQKMIPAPVQSLLKTSQQDFSHGVLGGITKMSNPWRALVLTWTPRWYANNIIGNMILGATAGVNLDDWAAAWKEFRGQGTADTARARTLASSGEHAITDSLAGPQTLVGIPGAESNNPVAAAKAAAGQAKLEGAGKLGQAKAGKAAVEARLQRANTWVDDLTRTAVFLSGKRKGLDEAAALQQTFEALVDYGDMQPIERQMVRAVVPFYAWQKGILKLLTRQAIDHPIRAAISQQLGMLNEELAGDLPEAYRGVVDLPGGLSLNTRPINPFMDATTLLTPQGIAGALNPFVDTAARNAFGAPESGFAKYHRINEFGQRVPDTAPAEDLLNIVGGLPQARLGSSVTGVGGYEGQPGAGMSTAKFAGLPVVSDEDVARFKERLAKAQKHQKAG